MARILLGLLSAAHAASFSGLYEGHVPGIVKISMDFSADTVKTTISVIGKQNIDCPLESYAATDSQISFPGMAKTGDCLGDNVRSQGKDTSKFFIDINSDGSLSFHSDFSPLPLKLTKQSLTLSAMSGEYSGHVPGIVKITMDFSAGTVHTTISVIGKQDIDCPSEPYAATDSQISFPGMAKTGDCLGDNVRSQGKDTSKFFIDINSDGSLSFHSDFSPIALKLTKQSLTLSAMSGAYSGHVPGIVKITMDFSAGTVHTTISVIGKQDIDCPSEPYAATDSQISFPGMAKTGDCLGDNVRSQGKDTSKFFIDINSDGSLSFHSDFSPIALKLTKQSLTLSAMSGEYSGHVPGIVKITMDFSAGTVHTTISVIGKQDIDCPSEPYAATDSQISFPGMAKTGDCLGDNVRSQGKDTSKFFIDINSDGSLSFHSDFSPIALKLTKQSDFVLV